MSFLARVFRRQTRRPSPARVVIPADLVERLGRDGAPLADAVVSALREHLDSAAAAVARAEAGSEGDRVPFWLAREQGGQSGIEDALRDRLERRRATESEADVAGRSEAAAPVRRPRRRADAPPQSTP